MGAAEGISVEKFVNPCKGCGTPTAVRFQGQPWHYKCIPAHLLAEAPVQVAALKLAFLEDLHETYGPKKKVLGRLRSPYWTPPQPEITDRVQVSSWNWARDDVEPDLPKAILDRTAAFLSAASSVEVAHGALVHNPEADVYRGLPGFYKVMWHPWEETGVPHPLGYQPRGADQEVWVPHTRAQLLQRLADAGRWPDGFISDAYTCAVEDGKPQAVRLDKWAKHVQVTRRAVIEKYGRYDEAGPNGMTAEYAAVKRNFSQAVTMMTGAWDVGRGRTFHPTCRVRRTDWGMAIADLSAVTLWGWCDDARQVMTDLGMPEYAPIGMRNVDELVVPYASVAYLVTTERPGGRRPLLIDPEGVQLGTFKMKAAE